jgi:hypothetical protein
VNPPTPTNRSAAAAQHRIVLLIHATIQLNATPKDSDQTLLRCAVCAFTPLFRTYVYARGSTVVDPRTPSKVVSLATAAGPSVRPCHGSISTTVSRGLLRSIPAYSSGSSDIELLCPNYVFHAFLTCIGRSQVRVSNLPTKPTN